MEPAGHRLTYWDSIQGFKAERAVYSNAVQNAAIFCAHSDRAPPFTVDADHFAPAR
jgi:hypothetical protein